MEDAGDHLRCNDNMNDEELLPLEFMIGKSTSTAELQPPPPFLVKTYKVVEDPTTDEVISWNEDGTGFVVWQPAEFSRDLLPTLFKHCNFSSFVRQLNTYGFRKVTTTRWEFSNEMFQKGQRELMSNIRRRKSKHWSHNKSHHQVVPTTTVKQEDHQRLGIDHHHEDQRSSSTSSSFEYTALLDENKCLKNENELLSSELGKTRKKCKQLMELVERYRGEDEDETDDEDGNEEDDGLKLFGVKLE